MAISMIQNHGDTASETWGGEVWGGRPWIKSCYNNKKDGIDVWYQICVA